MLIFFEKRSKRAKNRDFPKCANLHFLQKVRRKFPEIPPGGVRNPDFRPFFAPRKTPILGVFFDPFLGHFWTFFAQNPGKSQN